MWKSNNSTFQNDDYSSFVFIIGWAFQWKSLLAIKIAEHYTFSAILWTDCFRNILRIQKSSKEILYSTSKLTKILFNKQRKEISNLLKNVLHLYASRWEKIVIEWIHFSKEFLKFALDHGAKCLLLQNNLSWDKKVELKKITTPITRVIDTKNGLESYVKHDNNIKIEHISYTHNKDKFKEIHDIISSDADLLNIEKIHYTDIDEGFWKICNVLDNHFTSKSQ